MGRSGGAPSSSGSGGATSAGGNAAGGGASGAPTTNSGGTGGAPDGGSDATTGGSAKRDWGPGDYPPDIMSPNYLEISGVKGQGSYVRQYKVHVPPKYDPKVPTPLLFCIHGLGQNAVLFCVAGAAMDKKSDAAGFILVMPNGYGASWNGGTCCGAASNEKLDDVALFRAIFAEVDKHVNIDHKRVYATGLSNGAFMSYRLACDAADLFAAVAPGAGAVGTNTIGAMGGLSNLNPMSDFTACNPSAPVSILDVHGTSDGLVAYDVQAPSLAVFAAKDGCGMATVPAAAPKSGGDTTCVAYPSCMTGTDVIGCSIEGGGHCWFGSSDCGTGAGALGAGIVGANSDTMMNTDAVWDFLSKHAKN